MIYFQQTSSYDPTMNLMTPLQSTTKAPHRRHRPAPSTAPSMPSILLLLLLLTITTATPPPDQDSNPCLLYLAQSTIPHAGLGMFAGAPFPTGQLIGRIGDAAFPTVDQDWHNSPPTGYHSKNEGDYHWPLTNYDWHPRDIGMENEAEDVSVTVTGFGAAPNCHFRLLNAEEHGAVYDGAGLDRYESPGAGASTPWFNRTTTAAWDIEAGSELFVDYGPNWFLTRPGIFSLVPLAENYERAQAFLREYGRLLVGTYNPDDLVPEKMSLSDEAQRDLWEIIKTFPYPTRERQALPYSHKDALRAIHGDIQTVEVENSVRSVEYLKEHGKCVDNIVPGNSTIPHAGRGAFATRFIPKGGLVAPAPVVHIADKLAVNMYGEMIGPNGNVVRNETQVIGKQLILNYMFGHENSSMLLFPYSSNVAYINHHATEYNTILQWTKDFDFFHHEEWLNKSVEFFEDQWTSGLMLEFVALRDIQPGEEVLINYGKRWQEAWDEHMKQWEPIPPEKDHNNLTLWTDETSANRGKAGYVRAEVFNEDLTSPIRTVEEQKQEPYPHSVDIQCLVSIGHDASYLFAPLTIPLIKRRWMEEYDNDAQGDLTFHPCNITWRYNLRDIYGDPRSEDEFYHEYEYDAELNVRKTFEDVIIHERHVITHIPWKAIRFFNKPYTSDIFLKKAFRHEMDLPDGLWPEAWMNLATKDEKN
ncbi:hypothetical protein HJC23_013014 [Cyclotella cryptica]|uniref:SET domain-containing protein n=1 Tax=Cyclotella cryptica TaxID=29204 RepID=A0ABD3QHK9_9STRA